MLNQSCLDNTQTAINTQLLNNINDQYNTVKQEAQLVQRGCATPCHLSYLRIDIVNSSYCSDKQAYCTSAPEKGGCSRQFQQKAVTRICTDHIYYLYLLHLLPPVWQIAVPRRQKVVGKLNNLLTAPYTIPPKRRTEHEVQSQGMREEAYQTRPTV